MERIYIIDMETKKLCRVCKEELKKGENVNRSDVKICNNCLTKEKKEREESKIESEDKMKCNKCKKFYKREEFLKILKNCHKCREQTMKKGKKQNDNENGSEDNENVDEIIRVTAKQIFEYLKNKYNIEEEYDKVIEEINQSKESEEEETE